MFALCASWPLYALALGSLAVVALSLRAVARAWPVSKRAALLVAPVALWPVFSAGVVIADLRWFRADAGPKSLCELMLFRLATF